MSSSRPPEDKRQFDFDRAMADSADLFGDLLRDVTLSSEPDDFIVQELGRLLEQGDVSSDKEYFRFIVQQGVRLEYEGLIGLRAQFAERLRSQSHQLTGRARKVLPHVLSAVEDVDCPLDRIGAVGRHYADRLFRQIENIEERTADSGAGILDSASRNEASKERLIASLVDASADTAPLVAETLFEHTADHEVGAAAIAALGRLGRSGGKGGRAAIRALAYAVSEPLLDETLETTACATLLDTWPLARTYLLFNLRKHTHEDIPFRWMELLIRTGEVRAVDRILEEVLLHSADATYREDLRAILDLLALSHDPGRDGKVLRLLRGPGVPPTARTLLTEWYETSERSHFIDLAWRDTAPVPDFVHLDEDFASFAERLSDIDMREVCSRWRNAFHESLGWIRYSRLPRSDYELELENDVEREIINQVSFRVRPDAGTVRRLVEHIREPWLGSGTGGTVPLVSVMRSRPRTNAWLEANYWRDINRLYLDASARFDAGDRPGAERQLSLIRAIEPGYPLAVMLEGAIRNLRSGEV